MYVVDERERKPLRKEERLKETIHQKAENHLKSTREAASGPGVARGEIVLLLVAHGVGNMRFAVDAVKNEAVCWRVRDSERTREIMCTYMSVCVSKRVCEVSMRVYVRE